MVETVIDKLDASRVIVIPAGDPPHKKEAKKVSFDERFNMVKAALKNIKEVFVSTIEKIKAPSDTYTLDTFQQLFKVNNLNQLDFKIPFVIGTDALWGLPSWGGAKELAENVLFIVFKRNNEAVPTELIIDGETVALETEIIDAKIPSISSSKIRDDIKNGKRPSEMIGELPESVAELIEEGSLYRE